MKGLLSKYFNLNKSAFSLTEMLVVSVISAIILFAILGIFSIGESSFKNLRKEAQAYTNILYGFELLKNSVHKANTVTIENWSNPPWVSQILVADNCAFGLYQVNSNPDIDFVYLRDKSNTSNRDVILSKPDTISLSFTQNGSLITVQVQGQKDNEPFNLITKVVKRN